MDSLTVTQLPPRRLFKATLCCYLALDSLLQLLGYTQNKKLTYNRKLYII